MSDFKRQLAKEFSESKEYREGYGESFTREFLAAQIKTIRKQRNLSQTELGGLIESNQGRVSIYEDKDYGRWNIDTVQRIAKALGCWLKISLESYGTLLSEAESFSGAGLMRPEFENDTEVRRLLEHDAEVDESPFAASRKVITDWLRRDTADLQPLCEWLQGIGLPGFSEGEDEFQWILWSLNELEDRESLFDTLASRVAQLITVQEIDVTPVGWRPEALLRNLFLLAANLDRAAALQAALDAVLQRELEHKHESGATRMGRDALSALRTAMERNQADDRWEPVWFEFICHGHHSVLPGTVQAGFDGLMRLRPSMEDQAYWRRLARGIREVELDIYRASRVVPGRVPDVIDELRRHVSTMFDFWADPRAAVELLNAALRERWMQEAVAAWSCAVFQREWEQVIQIAPAPLTERAVASALFDGLEYQRLWNDAAPSSSLATSTSALLDRAEPRIRKDLTQLAA